VFRGVLFGLLAGAAATPLRAQYAPFTFEGFVDGTILTNQYTAATFLNAIVLGAGITLNQFECPPHAGSNVASDNGGPMTIAFTSALRSFAGYFTYSVPLTVQALDISNHPLVSAISAFSNNEALSGASGSHPNELLQLNSSAGIYKIVITGGSQGSSFTVDDAVVYTRCDLNLDGATNVADAQAMLNEALGATSAADDLNGDGVVNIVDVQIVINAALAMGCPAS
jgi:hypothetical protein